MPPKKFATPIKSTKRSSLTHEESDDLEFRLEKVDFLFNQEKIKEKWKKKMNENKEGIKMKINENKEEIQKSMILMENVLLQKLPKRYLETQGNHEHKENDVVENQSHMGSMLSQLEIKNFESQNHNHEFSIQDPHHQGFKLAPMSYYILNIDMRKFDGNAPVTWIFRMEKYFDLHKVVSLQEVNM